MEPGKTISSQVGPLSVRRRLSVLPALLQSWGKQLYKYTLVGGAVLLLDLATYWLIIRYSGSWYLYAHFISRTLGGVACFVLNRRVTFKKAGPKDLGRDLFRFVVLYGASFVLSSVLVYANVTLAGLHPVTGKVIAECTIFLFNYTVMKYWVLRQDRL